MQLHIAKGALAPLVILGLAVSLSACAGPVGTAAGMAVGGVGWGAMKTGELAFKGGKGGAHIVMGTGRVIGKTAVAGGRAAGEEFGSNKDAQKQAATQLGDLAQR